jgi:hypothetical protein
MIGDLFIVVMLTPERALMMFFSVGEWTWPLRVVYSRCASETAMKRQFYFLNRRVAVTEMKAPPEFRVAKSSRLNFNNF